MEDNSKEYKEIELRSEEVQEVMNRVPPWVLRYGIAVLFFVVIILLIGSYLFRYPDIVQAEIVVTTNDPPVSIYAYATGKLDQIYVQNNSFVRKGELLGVIENPAIIEDILILSRALKDRQDNNYEIIDKQIFNKPFNLGALQPAYTTYINCLNDYQNFKKTNHYKKKIILQEKQLKLQQDYYNNILIQYPVIKEQFKTTSSIFKRDSIIYAGGLISENDYDLSYNTYLQNKQNSLSFQANLKQIELQLRQKEESLLDLKNQAFELESKYKISLYNASEELSAQMRALERDYFLFSPIDGTINYMGIWSINQDVKIGDIIFTIAPLTQDKLWGKALLPVQGAGKVRLGQRVNVHVDNFPDNEYGYMIGKIVSISSTPTPDGLYVVEVDFPEGTKTSYNKTLPCNGQMQGQAEIITEDLRLIERFILPIKKLIMDQKR